MDEYLVELGGYEYAVEAGSEQEARQKAMLAHVKSVGQDSVQQAVTGAEGRREEALSREWNPGVEAALAGMSGEGGAYADPNATGGDILKRAAGMATMLGAGATGVGLATAPVATLKGLGGGLVGSAVGNEAGQWVGKRIPGVGGETLGNVLGGAGGLVGGGTGAAIAPRLSAGKLLSFLPGGGRGGMLAEVLSGGRGAGAGAANTEAQAAKMAVEAEKMALKKKSLEIAERRLALMEQREAAKATGVPKPARRPSAPEATPTEGATALQPEADFIDPSAVKVLSFPGKGKATMPTNLGGKAKPGPAPTPQEKLEETLRASLDAIKAKKAAAQPASKLEEVLAKKLDAIQGDSPLQAPRIQVGAQKVGRQVGMSKEEVRQAAGPVLGETRGEASPILPKQALQGIIDTMRAIPIAQREAYVARATSGKAQWQIENIRRTLEHLGLLVPAGVAAGGMMQAE